MPKNLWVNEKAQAAKSGLEELTYRSNLLGTDRSVANWGGGNTSAKTTIIDFRGREVEVMWVKGSGSDLGTMQEKHFTALRMDDVRPLFERDAMSDEDMVAYLANSMVDSKRPRASIETLLHAFLPFKHVDHTHPDAIISICCADNGRELAEKIYGNRFVWVPYIRPGFTLSKMIAQGVLDNPNAELVLMEKHGLVTWGETSAESYARTIAIINEAETYIESQVNEAKLFGGSKYSALPVADRTEIVSQIMPILRGAVSKQKKMILTYDDSHDVLQFVNSADAVKLTSAAFAVL